MRAFASAEIVGTWIAGSAVPMAGGSLDFRLSPWLTIGGAARIGLTHSTVRRQDSAVDLHFGYAGVTVGVAPSRARWPGVSVVTLFGGGSATSSDPGVGGVTDADNGLVIEPGVGYERRLTDRLTATGRAAWRWAHGFRVLGAVRSRDLRGPSASVGLTIGPF